MTTRIKLRRDTAANWLDNNPILALGEPGIETDTNKFKFGDGVTAWSSLSYASGGGDTANRTVAYYYSDTLGLYATSTTDGQNWTSPMSVDMQDGNWYGVDNIAVGPNGIAFTYGSANGPWISFAPSAYESPITLAQPMNVTHEGLAGEEIYWNNIRYLGGYYIAVGNLYTTDVVTTPNITIPYWAYSQDGKNWTRGGVNKVNMETLVDTEYDNNSGVNGLQILDVAYNGTGWLFNCQWTGTTPTERPGGFYITNIGSQLATGNYSSNVPLLDVVKWAGTGWVGVQYDTNSILRSIANTNPLATTWSSSDYASAIVSQLGPWEYNPYYPGIYGLDCGDIGGTNYTVLTTDYGRAMVTTDLGETWHAVVPNPKKTYITDWDTGTDGNSLANVPMFAFAYWSGYVGQQITITGASVSGMNGVWYVGGNSGSYHYVYRTPSKNSAASTSGWNVDSISVTVNATYGSNTLTVSDMTGVRVGMYLDSDGPASGTIIAVDTEKKTVTLDRVVWSDMFDWNYVVIRPTTTYSTSDSYSGEVIYSPAGHFLIHESFFYTDSGWSKSTDPINSWNGGGSFDVGNPGDGYNGIVAVSNNTVGAPASSWTYRNPRYLNSVSVAALTDKFQVSVGGGGGEYATTNTVNLMMDPNIAGWRLGAEAFNFMNSSDLGTVSSFYNNDVRFSINDHVLGIDNNGKLLAPSSPDFGNAHVQANGYNNATGFIFKRFDNNSNAYQKLIGTDNGEYTYHDVERLIIAGGDSYYDGNTSSFVGEGGDIYLWAGKGEDGGDIKIYAGQSLGTGSEGGYINITAGQGATTGGTVRITAGQGGTTNGDVVIAINGAGKEWTFGHAGNLTVPGNVQRNGMTNAVFSCGASVSPGDQGHITHPDADFYVHLHTDGVLKFQGNTPTAFAITGFTILSGTMTAIASTFTSDGSTPNSIGSETSAVGDLIQAVVLSNATGRTFRITAMIQQFTPTKVATISVERLA